MPLAERMTAVAERQILDPSGPSRKNPAFLFEALGASQAPLEIYEEGDSPDGRRSTTAGLARLVAAEKCQLVRPTSHCTLYRQSRLGRKGTEVAAWIDMAAGRDPRGILARAVSSS